MNYTHAKCTFDNIELLVFNATFNKKIQVYPGDRCNWWRKLFQVHTTTGGDQVIAITVIINYYKI